MLYIVGAWTMSIPSVSVCRIHYLRSIRLFLCLKLQDDKQQRVFGQWPVYKVQFAVYSVQFRVCSLEYVVFSL